MSIIRDATSEDLPALVRLLGQLNETPSPAPTERHVAAYAAVAADPRQRLLVVEHEGGVVGTAAMIMVPNLGHNGTPYALVENVVVDESARGQGHGELLMRHIIDEARGSGCYKVVLTSRKHRRDAHRFYERLGFDPTSEGFRYTLIPD
jgi:N-acetylglutamate synthase-like GNAT family acetyltransferase